MTTEDAKNYLALRQIPQLFESLMTGLMYYRPDDHITYLQDCLRKVQSDGVDDVRWNLFIQQRLKTPLPPITPDNGLVLSRDPSFITEGVSKGLVDSLLDKSISNPSHKEPKMPPSLEEKRGSPLPPIRQSMAYGTPKPGAPNCPVVLFMGGPGCGKATQCQRLIDRYSGWVHVSMGDVLRKEIMDKGSADDKWDMVSSLVQKGEMAPEDMALEIVLEQLKTNQNASGIILEGYPRTLRQIQQFNENIGRVDLVIMLDCEEKYLQQRLLSRGHETGRVDDNINAVAARIAFFKENTLPAIKYFDDAGKLAVIDGDRDTDEIFFDVASIFEAKFFAPTTPVPRPPTGQKPVSPRPGSTRYSRPGSRRSRPGSAVRNEFDVDIKVPDSGRKEGLPRCPIILIMGGPGSGRSTLCKRMRERFPRVACVSIGDLLKAEKDNPEIKKHLDKGEKLPEDIALGLIVKSLKDIDAAEAILIEGYPHSREQVESFNTFVGGANLAVILDCEEHTMRKRLAEQFPADAIDRAIALYREKTLPIIGHYDDKHLLKVVNGEKSPGEVFAEVSAAVSESIPLTDYLASLTVSSMDLGRLGGLPTCPIISIIGAPGSGHDAQCKKVAEKYGFVHVAMSENDSVSNLVAHHTASKGIILESYPRNQSQLEDFNRTVGGLDGVVVVDVSEDFAQENAGSLSDYIEAFKKNTLPVLGYFDDQKRLKHVRGEKNEAEVFDDLTKAIDEILSQPRSQVNQDSYYRIQVPDEGRKPGLPDAKIIAVIGAPKSKTDVYCKRATEKYPGCVHIQAMGLSADDLVQKIKDTSAAEIILLENFPAHNGQVEMFNSTIGGMSGAIVVDTSEDFVLSNGAEQEFIDLYKSTTVYMLSHYDQCRLLRVIKGEQEEDAVFADVCSAIDDLLKGNESEVTHG